MHLRAGSGTSTNGGLELQTGDTTPRITISDLLITFGHAALRFDDVLESDCSISILGTSTDGYDLFIQAQETTGVSTTAGTLHLLGGLSSGTNTNGGDVLIAGGVGAGTGSDGNIAFGKIPNNYQSMEGGIYIADSTAVPTGTPTNGGFLYADSGALKYRGSSDTTTTLGAADPHCSRCDRDFALEWKSPKYGYLAICAWCLTEALDNIGVIEKKEIL